MFFKKKKVNYEEAPQEYWEKDSYMVVILDKAGDEIVDNIFDNVSKIKGVKIKEKQKFTSEEVGKMVLTYEDEEYEVGFYPSVFSTPEVYMNKYFFTKEEIDRLTKANPAMTIFMKFHDDAKKSYHFQLKLAYAIDSNLLALLDESAEKLLPKEWVKMAVESNVLPSATDLYTVQAVSGENHEVWLHTHGLARCGITELEILESSQETYNSHYNLLSTFASYLIDKKGYDGSAYIGVLSNRQPVVATYVSWTKGILEYDHLTLGNINDRKHSHNSKTSIIFLYKSEEDEKNGNLSKVSVFNSLWNDNPMFFISDEATAMMKALAQERFSFVHEEAKLKECKVDIKIGLPIDKGDNFEHIWFELLGFDGDKFKAKLLQDPYDVKSIKKGDERWFTVDDVTDWIIYRPEFVVTPKNAYIITKTKDKQE